MLLLALSPVPDFLLWSPFSYYNSTFLFSSYSVFFTKIASKLRKQFQSMTLSQITLAYEPMNLGVRGVTGHTWWTYDRNGTVVLWCRVAEVWFSLVLWPKVGSELLWELWCNRTLVYTYEGQVRQGLTLSRQTWGIWVNFDWIFNLASRILADLFGSVE